MLTYLSIKNYLTVESLEMNFKSNMTCITGETGAGKSILLGAISTTLGESASSSLVRNGSDKLEVTSIFNIKELPNVMAHLKDFEWYDDDELVLRRIITADGKNNCFINSHRCKVSDLKKISELLITFHDQNQQQNLVKAKRQLSMLDHYCGNQEKILKVKSIYGRLKKAREKLFNVKNNFEETNAMYQLLTYQANEIEELDLKPNESIELEEEVRRLSKASDYLQELGNAQYILENDENDVLSQIRQVIKNLDNIDDNNKLLTEIRETVESALINLQEAAPMIQAYADTYEIDPQRLNEASDRLDRILTIAGKHKIQPEKISVLYRELKERLDQMECSDMDLELLQKDIDNLVEEYIEAAKLLRTARLNGIPLIEKEINTELVKLNFNEDIFTINLESNKPDYLYDSEDQFEEHGIDRVDFYIQPNLGQEKQLLSKSASGGELSRISLVLELISSRKNAIPTLIFDEVDSGIGGETGDAVGELLNEIGVNNQLFVITHLPQVAAKAQNHIVVKKLIKNDITHTHISEVVENDRVQEVARMLGGSKNISKETWQFARQLMGIQ